MYVSIAERVYTERWTKEGVQEGERLAKLDTARNLLAMGLTMENIAKATGLSEDDVRNLLN